MKTSLTGLSDIFRVLARGWKIILFRRFLPGTFMLSVPGMLVIFALAIALDACMLWTADELPWGFNPDGLNAAIAGITISALLLYALKTRRHFVDVGEALTALTVANIWIKTTLTAVALLTMPSPDEVNVSNAMGVGVISIAFFVAALIWWLGSLYWTGRQLSQFGFKGFGMRAVAVSLLVTAIVPQQMVFNTAQENPLAYTNIWAWIDPWADNQVILARTPEPDPDAKPIARLNIEELLDRQPETVNAALDTIKPSSGDDHNIYFVGMGSYADQDVFMREIRSTQTVFDTHFETKGRSLLLNNNRETADTLPIASASNLRRVVNALAKKMDVKKDVLVLYITTHGSQGLLSVDLPGSPLNQISDDMLAKILNDSGIVNRVVIISACHAGSFIPALANDDTLVLTAAHADNVSFGCSNDRDWTYFGDALINHGLRETRSMTDAFKRAEALVAEWEARDGMIPSEPQMSLGRNIAPKLDALARRLQTREASNAAPTNAIATAAP